MTEVFLINFIDVGLTASLFCVRIRLSQLLLTIGCASLFCAYCQDIIKSNSRLDPLRNSSSSFSEMVGFIAQNYSILQFCNSKIVTDRQEWNVTGGAVVLAVSVLNEIS